MVRVLRFGPDRLVSLHAGVALEEVHELTGFEFRVPDRVPVTSPLDPEARRLLYGPVKEKLALACPHFAARLRRSVN